MWMIEIGRIDIETEVSIISSFLAYPREGNRVAAFNITEYLKQKHNYCFPLEPTYPLIYNTTFNDGAEWKELYGDSTKEIPPDNIDPRGK